MSLRIFLLFAVTLAFAACGNNGRKSVQTADTTRVYVFKPALAPAGASAAEAREYLRVHYWDKFDFADTLFVTKADSMLTLEAFARYIMIISDRPTDPAPMDTLMRRASVSRTMLDYFAGMANEVLHNPNSPLRNDEFYIPVLETQLASPYYDQYERIAPMYDLEMAMKNRVGHVANDIRYTLASGRTGTLYNIKSEYTLLFASNPDCPMCKQITGSILQSPMLSEMVENGRLTVLVLYPDEDLTTWHKYVGHIPAQWINAYDDGCVIRETNAYDFHAIPSLYLLDRQKHVLVKDSTDIPYIEEVIDRRG